MIAWTTRLGLVAAAGVLCGLTPTRAQACLPDVCFDASGWTAFDVVSSALAPNGVIVFQTARASSAAEADALAFVDVVVTDAGGQPIEGTVQSLTAEWGAIVWRPAQPLSAGDQLEVSVSVDNDALSAALDPGKVQKAACTENLSQTVSLGVTLDPIAALALGQPTTLEEFDIVEDAGALEGLVCCDGAIPENPVGSCIPEAIWDTGYCAQSAATGFVLGELSIEDALGGSVLLENMATRLAVVGQTTVRGGAAATTLRYSSNAAFCAAFEVHSLATGETWISDEYCFGENEEQLGPSQLLDVADALEAACTDAPYVCDLLQSGERWDETACTPWDDGGSTDDGNTDDGNTDGNADDGNTDGNADGGNTDGNADDGGTNGSDTNGADGNGADGNNDGAGGGCSCQASGNPVGATWLMMLLAIPVIRRRRLR